VTTRGSSKTSASSEAAPAGYRWAWLAALLFYGVAAASDLTYHLLADLRTGDRIIEYSDVAVAFAAALFWPLDLAAMPLLPPR
jgi:hypothetical protein